MAGINDHDDDILNEDYTDEDIIELTDIVDDQIASTDDGLAEPTGIIVEKDNDLASDFTSDNSKDDENDSAGSQNLNLTQDQLADALEKVIEKKFGDKIEAILFEITEKVIDEQIIKIKKSLQKDLDQI